MAEVFTPKDFSLTQAMAGIVRAIRDRPRTGLVSGPVNPDLPSRIDVPTAPAS